MCLNINVFFWKLVNKQLLPVCLQFDLMTSFLKFINSQRGSHNFLLLLAHKRLWTQSRQKLLRVIFSKLNDFCVRNFAIIYIFKSIAFYCRGKSTVWLFSSKTKYIWFYKERAAYKHFKIESIIQAFDIKPFF